MDNTIQSDLIRGHINTIILNSLYEGDKYGYEIMKEISERSAGQYTLKQPTLYSSLKRLEKQGLIKPFWSNAPSGGGRRKYYTLTNIGRDICMKSQAEWEYSRTLIDSLVSDKKYDLTQPAPEDMSIKIVKTKRQNAHAEDDDDNTYDHNEDETDDSAETEQENQTTENEAIVISTNSDQAKSADEKDEKQEDMPSAHDTPSGFSEHSPAPQATLYRSDADAEEEKTAHVKTAMFKPVEQPVKSYAQFITSGNNPETLSDQYDLFSDINVDIDKNILEYEKVAKTYAEKNTQSDVSDEDGDRPILRCSDEYVYDAPEIEDRLSRVENGYDEEPQSTVGFSAQNSSFIEVEKDSDMPPESEYELSKRMDEIKREQAERAAEAERLADQAAIMNEIKRDETKAEKEYKILLSRLLTTANSSTIDDSLLQNDTVMLKPQTDTPVTETLAAATDERVFANKNVKEDDVDQSLFADKKIVDFSELQLRMQREGFKVRTRESEKIVSPPGSYIKVGDLLFHTLLIIFAVIIVELSVVYFALGQYFNFNMSAYITMCCCSLLLPLGGLAAHLYYKNKNIYDRYKFGFTMCMALILTAAVFIFSCAAAFLFGVNLELSANIMTYIALPAVIALDIPIGVLVYTALHKKKRYLK